jgi:hypothetical protein
MNKEQLINQAKGIFKKISNLTYVSVFIASGFAIGYYSHEMKSHLKTSEFDHVRTVKNTSAAVNESGELLILDRVSGDYAIYSDSVGKMIFDIYASRIYYQTK